jgi:hypothetical protein
MDKPQFIEYKGIKYYLLDFCNSQPAERNALIEECGRQVQSQREKSVYVVTKVTGVTFDSELINFLKQLAKNNEPYVIKSAVIGLRGMQKVAMMIISSFSNRTFHEFDSVDKAVEFFVADSLHK